jgi:hypothetical protein
MGDFAPAYLSGDIFGCHKEGWSWGEAAVGT